MKYILFMGVLFILMTALSWADSSDDDWSPSVEELCSQFCSQSKVCGAPCQIEFCESACPEKSEQGFNDCLDLTECEDYNDCFCKEVASWSGDDDGGCGGCDIAGAGAGAALSSVMMAIGLAALVISRRGRRS